MEFDHEEHWALYQRVRDCMEREFGDDAEAFEDEPAWFMHLGDVPLLVSVGGAGPKAAVTIYGRPGEGVEITADLAFALLRANFEHEIPFGALGLNPNLDVSFNHVVMGEGFDADAFSLLVRLVADKLGDIEQMIGDIAGRD